VICRVQLVKACLIERVGGMARLAETIQPTLADPVPGVTLDCDRMDQEKAVTVEGKDGDEEEERERDTEEEEGESGTRSEGKGKGKGKCVNNNYNLSSCNIRLDACTLQPRDHYTRLPGEGQAPLKARLPKRTRVLYVDNVGTCARARSVLNESLGMT